MRDVYLNIEIFKYRGITRSVMRTPPIFNLLALVRRHPLYILLRVRRELCFR